jgi:hypothetical protein
MGNVPIETEFDAVKSLVEILPAAVTDAKDAADPVEISGSFEMLRMMVITANIISRRPPIAVS